ncbi:MAG: RNA 2',3'-cyclic phosphodiesterase [Bacillota bacterium]
MDRLRLFWAVTLPAPVKEALAAVGASFRQLPLDVKWVETGNLHITVYFLGDTDRNLVGTLVDAVTRKVSGFRGFTLSLGGVGVFPSLRKPRVLWVGLADFGPLVDLHRLIEKTVVALGFSPDDKPFSPHVTIGRFRSMNNSAALGQKIEEVGTQRIGEVKVEGLELMSSRLRPSGPIYTPVTRISF